MVKLSARLTHAEDRTEMEFHLRFGQEIRLRPARSRTRVHLDQIYGIGGLIEVRDGQFERKCRPQRARHQLAVSRNGAVKELTGRASVDAVAAGLVWPCRRTCALDEDTAVVNGLAAIKAPVGLNPL